MQHSAKVNNIKLEFPEHKIYTDADLFSILNGNESFLGKKYSQDDMHELCKEIEKDAAINKLLIHTFNPSLINLLEAHTVGVNDYSIFSMELSKDRFFIFNSEQEFIQLLKIPEFARKLDILSVGEAVCDSIISDYT